MTEIELIEKAAVKVGMTSLLNHGAASCVYSEGCNGVTQEHLVAFTREIALHCVAALAGPAANSEDPRRQAYDDSMKEFFLPDGSARPEGNPGVPLLDGKTFPQQPPMPQSDRMDGQGEQR